MVKSDREYRNMAMTARADEDEAMTVEGYASTFDDPYTLWETEDITVREVVDKNAFDDTDLSDVIMQYNHEGRVFARVSNNTLKVSPDDQGLFIAADLGGTEIGRGLFEEIRGGYTDKMSFGFTVAADEWDEHTDENGHTTAIRTIKKVGKVYDVSAVSIPANPGTSIDATSVSVRNLTDGVIQRIQTERSEQRALELKRRQIQVRARAIGESHAIHS